MRLGSWHKALHALLIGIFLFTASMNEARSAAPQDVNKCIQDLKAKFKGQDTAHPGPWKNMGVGAVLVVGGVTLMIFAMPIAVVATGTAAAGAIAVSGGGGAMLGGAAALGGYNELKARKAQIASCKNVDLKPFRDSIQKR